MSPATNPLHLCAQYSNRLLSAWFFASVKGKQRGQSFNRTFIDDARIVGIGFRIFAEEFDQRLLGLGDKSVGEFTLTPPAQSLEVADGGWGVERRSRPHIEPGRDG